MRFRGDLEEHQLLGTARGLGDTGQGVLAGQRVERTGLAGVGAAGEGHFGPFVGRQLPHVVGRKVVTSAFDEQ